MSRSRAAVPGYALLIVATIFAGGCDTNSNAPTTAGSATLPAAADAPAIDPPPLAFDAETLSEDDAIKLLRDAGAIVKRQNGSPGGWTFGIIEESDDIRDEHFALLRRIDDLTTVGMQGGRGTSAAAQQLRDLPDVEVVSLAEVSMTDEDLEVLKTLPNLREVRLYSYSTAGQVFEFTDRACEIVGELGGLNRLTLMLAKVTDRGVRQLSGLENLQELAISGVSDGGMSALSSLKNLEFLTLSGSFSDTGIAHLASLKRLNVLALASSNPSFGTRDLAVLSELPQLDTLELSGRNVGPAAFRALESVSQIRELKITRIRPRQNSMASLARLPNLEVLRFENVPLTDADLEHLKGSKSLKRLEIDCGSVSDRPITDAGIAAIAAIENLESLVLRSVPISSRAARYLWSMRQLKSVGFGGITISDDDLHKLKARRRDLRIESVY